MASADKAVEVSRGRAQVRYGMLMPKQRGTEEAQQSYNWTSIMIGADCTARADSLIDPLGHSVAIHVARPFSFSEWGLGTRLTVTINYGVPLSLSNTSDRIA